MELARFGKGDFAYNEASDDEFLGAGSFGQVFRATIKGTSQVVALKILNAPQRLSARSIVCAATMHRSLVTHRVLSAEIRRWWRRRLRS